ncbi:MAG: NADH-quinone oxidoreductase subunit NuoG [Thermodesulfovibrionia bacterium]
MITITINEKEIRLDEPVTVLEAARRVGIKIPTLCNHELLEPYGGCRLCVVEVERMPKLMTSCTLMAADGMVIRTESEAITRARRSILEFLLINHPLDCPYCDKAGECELQDAVMRYGPEIGRFKEEKRKVPESHDDPIFARNMERCISCTRCVRACANIQGASAITMVSRGGRTSMEPFSQNSFNCEYCGNCLLACPVGSILSRGYIHSYRPWQMQREVVTICGYCGVGCSLRLQIRDNAIKRVWSVREGVNSGLLCSKGIFGYEFISSDKRLREPLIRKEGELKPSTWDSALDIVAKRLLEIKERDGGRAIGGIASPRCTNEDNYIFQKFMRLSCGSNNIDSISRLGFASAQAYLEGLLGQGITANLIGGIRHSDTILVLGGDPTSINPILGLAIRHADMKGSNVIVIGNSGGLDRFKTLKITPPLFREADTLESILISIYKAKGRRSDTHIIDEEIDALSERVITHFEGLDKLMDMLLNSKSMSIILGPDLVTRMDGHNILFYIAGIVYLLEARLYLLSEFPNEQGLIDMGCVPHMLPGCRPIDIGDFRMRYEELWNAPLPVDKGLTLMEMIEAIKEKRIRGLYVMGENPVFNLPNNNAIIDALRSLEFLVVQDIFLTETARLADVVLPAVGWSEKEGTYTNLERRLQYLPRAVKPSFGMEDWRIISGISNRMGYGMDYSSPSEIMKEISSVSPLHKGLNYEVIKRGDRVWPYDGEPLRGGYSEIKRMTIGHRDFNGDFYLCVDKPLFHSGSISQRSRLLTRIYPEPLLRISEREAKRLGLKDGDDVIISTKLGSMGVKVKLDKTIDDRRVYLSNNYEGSGVMSLIDYKINPITMAPAIEGNEVTIKKGVIL